MKVSINTRYDFKFDTNNGFDAFNGIYLVERALVYTDIINEDIDIYELLYSKVGLQRADFETDISNHLNGIFYKLVSVTDQSVIWIPEGLIKSYPNPDVQEYNLVALTTELGVFDDPATLVAIKQAVHDVVKARVGAAAEPNTAVVVYSTTWMTKEQYAAAVLAREEARGSFTVPGDVKNYYKEFIDQQTANAALIAENSALETIIANLTP